MAISTSFQLPVTQVAAESLVTEYLFTISPYLDFDEKNRSLLINDLESLKNQATAIASQMLTNMGYSGSLPDQEKALNKAIAELQKGTSFLNGEELGEFFIWELAKAAPFSFRLQEVYTRFLETEFGIATEEQLAKMDLTTLADTILALAGIDNQYNLRVSEDGTSVQGRGGKFGGGTARFTKSLFFRDLTTGMQNTLKKAFDKAGLMQTGEKEAEEGASYDFQIDEKSIYNFLKLKTTPYKGQDLANITELIEKDPELLNKTKTVLSTKLLSNYSGNYKDVFQSSVNYVLNKAEAKDLFAGQNAAKKITGLFGEIQGLYYMRVLFPNANLDWVATEGSVQPHADLILELAGERYGIQVKNTSKGEAFHEVNFENFKANVLGGSGESLNLGLLKEEGMSLIEGLSFSQDVFNAAGGLIGMESFNIECDRIGKKYQAMDNPEFSSTRKRIEYAARQAQKAMQAYAAGMMFMQLRPMEKGATNSNALYLIGGSLAITGATILTDIINDLERELSGFKLTFMNQKGTPGTIVDFYNTHEKTSQYILQSSYTFNLN